MSILRILCAVFLSILCAPPVGAESPAMKVEMRSVKAAFQDLQLYLVRQEDFFSPRHHDEIVRILTKLQEGFHHVTDIPGELRKEPGFMITLQVTTDLIADARNRFLEQRKGYALWRLRAVSNHCVTCHARTENGLDLSERGNLPSGLNALERAEFYLASRQLENAREAFLEAVQSPALAASRSEALRKWLVLSVRLSPDPKQALSSLTGIAKNVELPASDKAEVQGWIESLRRWKENGSRPGAGNELAEAENLIRQGTSLNDPLSGRRGTVELLRGTALLHRGLERGLITGADRARALYALASAYHELPLFFVNELPELFLEQAIREYPNTEGARRSFELYKEIATVAYTGSAGTQLPADIAAELRELHDIAYGVPVPPGRG